MSFIKRVQALEKYFGVDVDTGAEAVIIYTEDCSLADAAPVPVTMFAASGQKIHRAEGESYQDFESRAIKWAFEMLPASLVPGRPSPAPLLLANGDLQE